MRVKDIRERWEAAKENCQPVEANRLGLEAVIEFLEAEGPKDSEVTEPNAPVDPKVTTTEEDSPASTPDPQPSVT